MKVRSGTKLGIFETFKTKDGDLTGEARRQRHIIAILAGNANPAERTRTGISQKIAKRQAIAWKNIYSGIFRDLDEILLPLGIVEEDGRLPLRRGPKALQEKGIPYYHLTKRGILAAISIREIKNRQSLLDKFFSQAEPGEREFEEILSALLAASPSFAYSVFEKYVRAFCDNRMRDLLPFDLSRLGEVPDESLNVQIEVLKAFMKLNRQQRRELAKLLDSMAYRGGAEDGVGRGREERPPAAAAAAAT